MIRIIPVQGIGEIVPGDDLSAICAAALREAGVGSADRPTLVITSKIVSKAEGRFVDLDTVEVSEEAERLAALTRKDPRLVALALREASAVVRSVPGVLITRHKLGFVMANSGIDQSNLGPGRERQALILPLDPDLSAQRIRQGIQNLLGYAPGIVISDSFGRPWRGGVTNVAIGASGLPALIDRRGEQDRDGRVLEVTQIAVADLLASAGGLVCGEGAEGVPAAIVTGMQWEGSDVPASALVRPPAEDLFK